MSTAFVLTRMTHPTTSVHYYSWGIGNSNATTYDTQKIDKEYAVTKEENYSCNIIAV